MAETFARGTAEPDGAHARNHGVAPSNDLVHVRAHLNLLRNRALIAVLFGSGGRISEVLSLTVGTVQRQERIVDMAPIRGKGRKRRSLRLDETART